MKILKLSTAFSLSAFVWCVFAAPKDALPADQRPVLPIPNAEAINANCDKEIAQARSQFELIESRKDKRNVFTAMNALNIFIEDKSGPYEIIGRIQSGALLRKTACIVR